MPRNPWLDLIEGQEPVDVPESYTYASNTTTYTDSTGWTTNSGPAPLTYSMGYGRTDTTKPITFRDKYFYIKKIISNSQKELLHVGDIVSAVDVPGLIGEVYSMNNDGFTLKRFDGIQGGGDDIIDEPYCGAKGWTIRYDGFRIAVLYSTKREKIDMKGFKFYE